MVKETLDKLEDSKQQDNGNKAPAKEPEILQAYTKRIDKNSIYALRAVLPFSKIHTLKFANNGFTFPNFELLIDAINLSPITRLFFDWNPITIPSKPKIEGQPDPPKDYPFAKLYFF